MIQERSRLGYHWVKKLVSKLLFFACLFSGFLLFSCQRAKENQQKTKEWAQSDFHIVRVLTTTAHVSALVKGVGGEYTAVLNLIQGESDPHSYQLVKGDAEKFRVSQIVFYSGLGLEHGPSLVQQLAQSNAISIGDEIIKNDAFSAIILDGTLDPHIWMDVSIWARGVFVIEEALSRLRPDLAPYFHENAKRLYHELMQLDTKGLELFQKIPSEKRYLVTTHDAFHYFARRYLAEPNEMDGSHWSNRCKAPEGLAPDGQMSTKEVLEIAKHIATHKIPVIFAEIGINKDSLRKLQEVLSEKKYSIRLANQELYSDSMGQEGSAAGTYSGMIWYNMNAIADEINNQNMDEIDKPICPVQK